MPLNGFLILLALFVSILALAGMLALGRRLDKAERRRVYETECIVKSLQALEQQNHMLSDRINTLAEVRNSLSKVISTAARRQANATEEEQTQQPVPPVSRLLH